MAGHDGLSGEVAGGGFGHYLHHAHYEVNYGTVKVPLDRYVASIFVCPSSNQSNSSLALNFPARRLFGTNVVDWPRSKPGALPGPTGVKEMLQVSSPLVMLAVAHAIAPA